MSHKLTASTLAMGQQLAHLTKVAWQREPIILISVIGGLIGPIGVMVLPSSQRTFQAVRDFPQEYPWPETADERRRPVLEVEVEEDIYDPVRVWYQKQFGDDLF